MARELAESSPGGAEFEVMSPGAARVLFWRPRFLRADPVLYHLPFLFWLVEALRPRLAVSLGDVGGVAHFSLCQAAERLDLETRFYGFGPWGGEDVPAALARHNADHYPHVSRLLPSGEPAGLRALPDGLIDLLSLHPAGETPAARATMLREWIESDWVARLSERGVVVVHGVNALLAADDGGLADLIGDCPRFHLDTGEGLLLLLRGAQPDERLARLCRLTIGDRGYGTVLRVLGHLGQALHSELCARDLAERVRELEDRLAGADAVSQIRPEPVSPALDPRDTVRAEQINAAGRAQIAALTAERDRLAQQVTAAEKAQDELLHRLTAAAEAAQIAAEDKRAALLQRLTAVESEIQNLQQALAKERAAAEAGRSQLRILKRQHDNVQTHARALQGTIDQLLTSTSWRLTAPIRRLMGIFRRS